MAPKRTGSLEVARCSVPKLKVGHHAFTATYSGDANYEASRGSATIVVAPTPEQVKSAVTAALAVSGKASRIGQLLEHHGYPTSFAAPSTGKLVISWETKANVLVARATSVLAKAARKDIEIALTPAGERLLKHSRVLKLTASGVFTPSGAGSTSASAQIVLRR